MTSMRRVSPMLLVATALVVAVSGYSNWQGANSLPLPGTAGRGPGSFTIQRSEERRVGKECRL